MPLPDWVWWLVGILLGVIFTLIGVIYWSLRAEVARLAKNIHELRGQISPILLWMAVIREKLGVGNDDERR